MGWAPYRAGSCMPACGKECSCQQTEQVWEKRGGQCSKARRAGRGPSRAPAAAQHASTFLDRVRRSNVGRALCSPRLSLGGARPPARAPGRNATPYQVLTACRIMIKLLSCRRRRDLSFFSVCLHLDSSQHRWRFVPADLMVPADFLDLPCFFAAALACALVASGTLMSLLSALFAAPLCPIVSFVSSSPSSLVHTAAAPRWPPRQRFPI